MQLKYQPDLKGGYNKIIDSSSNLNYIEEFGILNLESASSFKDSSKNTETGLVVLEGVCSIKVQGQFFENIGQRTDLFQQKPEALYIPSGLEYEISGGPAKIAVCKAKSQKQGEPLLISSNNIQIKTAGKDNWQREVRMVLSPETISQNLIIGETINPAGNWSGTPAHRHDNEELYYFLGDKPQAWAQERIYSEDRSINEIIHLQNNTVTIMPRETFHQVVAGPGYNFYYFWFIAGKDNKLTAIDDPDDKWIKE